MLRTFPISCCRREFVGIYADEATTGTKSVSRFARNTLTTLITARAVTVIPAKQGQLTSYKAQIDYYTRYIQAQGEWDFVKVYTDEGEVPQYYVEQSNEKHRGQHCAAPHLTEAEIETAFLIVFNMLPRVGSAVWRKTFIVGNIAWTWYFKLRGMHTLLDYM